MDQVRQQAGAVQAPMARLVAGFGRSGTTWVQDVLAEANKLRPVFEPLHPLHIPGAAAHARRYVAEGDEEPELYQLLSTYFYRPFHSLWADYRVVRRRLLPAPGALLSPARLRRTVSYARTSQEHLLLYRKKRRRPERLLKCVRANMMLGWIRRRFDARIVFLIRHPAAVVLSQMRALRSWRPQQTVEQYRQDEKLLAQLDEPTRRLLFGPLSDFEALTLAWCIENTVALRQAAAGNIPVVHYETLLELGAPEWARLRLALELPEMPDEGLVARPSQQAHGGKVRDAGLLSRYALWREELEPAAAAAMQKILDITGVTIYNTMESLPASRPEGVSAGNP